MEKRVLIYSLIGLLVLVGLIFAFSGGSKQNQDSNSDSSRSSENQQATNLGNPTFSCLSIDYATKKPSGCTQLYENSPTDQFESVKKACEMLVKTKVATWSTDPCPSEGATICDLKVYKNYLYDEEAIEYAKSKGQC